MSVKDDQQEVIARIHAIWMLLRPVIEQRAQEIGASPIEMALAMTIGTPTYIAAATKAELRSNALNDAAKLFTETCVALTKNGEL